MYTLEIIEHIFLDFFLELDIFEFEKNLKINILSFYSRNKLNLFIYLFIYNDYYLNCFVSNKITNIKVIYVSNISIKILFQQLIR